MYDIDKWEDRLIADIGEKRFKHSKRVMKEALRLNTKLDDDLVKTAAILHDCAKYNEEKYYELYKDNIDKNELDYKEVLHSFLGAEVAKKVYNINNEEALDAIRFHTTGRENMTELDKIIYLADAIEPKRDYPGVDEIRRLAEKSIDEAVYLSLKSNISYLIEIDSLIHPNTLLAYNFLVKEKNE